MKATDIVNKVELEVDYQKLIELMRAGRQVDFVLPAPETDGDGYLTWDTEYWTTVDNKRFIRTYSHPQHLRPGKRLQTGKSCSDPHQLIFLRILDDTFHKVSSFLLQGGFV